MWKLEPKDEPKPAFVIVAEHMNAFRAGKLSIQDHVAWLQRRGEVPFVDQARLFAPLYWNNKLSYRLRHLSP
jgi:hypothetical protein